MNFTIDYKEKGNEKISSELDLSKSGLFEIKNWSIKKINDLIHCIWDDSNILDSPDCIHSDPKSFKMDLIYLKMASIWAKNSHCKRMQVGCLMVNDRSIISDGYNGSPTGFPNVCENENMETLPYVLHAEANAITKLAKSTQTSNGSTIYVTLSPCFECSKLIIQSGIKRVVFSEMYRKPESIGFLVDAGIEVVKIKNFDQI